MACDILEIADERILEAYGEYSNQDVKQINPIVIEIIKELLFSVLQGCLKQGNSFTDVKKNSSRPLIGLAFRRAMRTSNYLSRPDAEGIIQTAKKVAQGSSVEEMVEFHGKLNFMV